jgi:drug/metabolite transporter (DMT)-like permease
MSEPSQEDLPRGARSMVGSALLFAAMGACVKAASSQLPNAMVVFLRSAVGLLLLLPWLVGESAPGWRTRHPTEHLLRGLFGLGSMYCLFFAVAHMRLADATLLNYCLPLFLPLVERVWLKEPLPRGLALPLCLGLLGVGLVLRPGAGLLRPVAFVGLSASVFAAMAQVGVRRLTRTEPVIRIVFYFGVVSTLGSALPLAWQWRTPTPRAWALMLATGAFATGAQILLTRAYSCAAAGRVGPFIFSGVVFAGAIEWLFWDVLPDRLSLLGALFVVGAAIGALRLRSQTETRAA